MRYRRQAIGLAPAFPEARAQLIVALNGMADAQLASGRLEDAERSWAKALALGNNPPRTLQGLGRLALARGDPPTAEKYLVAALAESDADADTLNWLGLSQLQQDNSPQRKRRCAMRCVCGRISIRRAIT